MSLSEPSTLPAPGQADTDARVRRWSIRFDRLPREQKDHLDASAASARTHPIDTP